MTTATQPRTLQVLARDAEGNPTSLAISTGKPGLRSFCRTVYAVECRPAGDGCHWRLTKTEGGSDAEAKVYDVLLSPTEGHHCDCKGFLRWASCKHVDACLALALREAQRPRVVACEWCGGSGLMARSDYRCRPCGGTGKEAA